MSTVENAVPLFAGTLQLAVQDRGEGRAFLVLHGGAGPSSVAGLAEALSKDARAIVPTHPGFAGQPRPDWFNRIDDLVLAYLELLARVDVDEVVVVGNSVGGWIAAEIGLRCSPRVAAIVLIDAVGIDTGSADRKIANPMELPPETRLTLAYHNPKQFAVLPQGQEASAMLAANQKAQMVYAGEPYMHSPSLRTRLAEMNVPALVIWGVSDRITDLQYGRRYAESIPNSRFESIEEAGHFPHIEKLNEVLKLIHEFIGKHGH